jgi:hypothetical protein
VFGALAIFVESCGDLMSHDDKCQSLDACKRCKEVCSKRWMESKGSRPRIVGSQPEWEECRPSDLGGVHSPLVWDIG